MKEKDREDIQQIMKKKDGSYKQDMKNQCERTKEGKTKYE